MALRDDRAAPGARGREDSALFRGPLGTHVARAAATPSRRLDRGPFPYRAAMDSDPAAPVAALSPVAAAYLGLLRRCLTRDLIEEPYAPAVARGRGLKPTALRSIQWLLGRKGLAVVRHDEVSAEDRVEGRGWPATAETMMGLRRMEFLERCLVDVVTSGVPGDFFEAGCWRGGGVVFMLGVLKALGDGSRRVWAADSFQGYPAPTTESHAVDRHLFDRRDYFAVRREDVEATVRRYDLADPRLVFLEGWFGESIPRAPIEALSFLRIDVDGYEGVRDALTLLYPKLSPGGYVLIEDVRQPGAKRAMDELLAATGEAASVRPVPQKHPCAVYWRKRG